MMELPVTIGDVIIIAVLLISAVHATMNGVVAELLRIAAWIVAAILTLQFYPVFKPVAQANIQPDWQANAAALAGLYLVLLIPLSFISYRISDAVISSSVGSLDRALGFFFGIARGLVILAVALIFLTSLVPEKGQPIWLREARLRPLVAATGNVILSLLPKEDRVDLGEERPPSREDDEPPEDDPIGDLIERTNRN